MEIQVFQILQLIQIVQLVQQKYNKVQTYQNSILCIQRNLTYKIDVARLKCTSVVASE